MWYSRGDATIRLSSQQSCGCCFSNTNRTSLIHRKSEITHIHSSANDLTTFHHPFQNGWKLFWGEEGGPANFVFSFQKPNRQKVIFRQKCDFHVFPWKQELMKNWWRVDEELMKNWWRVYEKLMVIWWRTDKELMMNWWWADEELMMSLWRNDDELIKSLWRDDEEMMKSWWIDDEELMKSW